MTTMDEASICPKCGKTGTPGPKMRSAKPGVFVVTVTCKTELCEWYDTGWMVSMDKFGNIPEPSIVPRGDKQFTVESLIEVDRNIQAANDAAAAMTRLQHGEIG